MYSFESLYPCKSIRIVDGALNIEGVFTVWDRRRHPIVLVARVSGVKPGKSVGYVVRLVRLDAENKEVWADAFRANPQAAGGSPAVLAALITDDGRLSPGVYLATMTLDAGQQVAASFRVK